MREAFAVVLRLRWDELRGPRGPGGTRGRARAAEPAAPVPPEPGVAIPTPLTPAERPAAHRRGCRAELRDQGSGAARRRHARRHRPAPAPGAGADPDHGGLPGAPDARLAARPLEHESFVAVLRTMREDPADALEAAGLPMAGRRRVPPTARVFRSAGLTLDSFLLRGAEVGTTWRRV